MLVSCLIAELRKGIHTQCHAEWLLRGQVCEGCHRGTLRWENLCTGIRELEVPRIHMKELAGRRHGRIKWGGGCPYKMLFWHDERCSWSGMCFTWLWIWKPGVSRWEKEACQEGDLAHPKTGQLSCRAKLPISFQWLEWEPGVPDFPKQGSWILPRLSK